MTVYAPVCWTPRIPLAPALCASRGPKISNSSAADAVKAVYHAASVVRQPPSLHQHAVIGSGSGAVGVRCGHRCAATPLLHLASSDVIYEPTGVPLVDELMKLGSVEAAAQRSIRLLAFLAAAALLGSLALRALDSAAGRRMEAVGQTGFDARAALVASASRPCRAMLPLYCATRAATVVLALAEMAAAQLPGDPASLLSCSMNGGLLATLHWCTLAAGAGSKQIQILPALQWLTQLVQDCSELVLIVAVAWTALSFKTRLIAWQARCIELDSDPHNDTAVPLLRLLSGALSVVIIMTATGITLVGFGFHIGALTASVGGVGVVLGLATQQLLANLAAAVSLVMTRPFVTGDHVQLVNPEGVEVEGEVLNIEPTRTILLDRASGCIVHVKNADVSEYIIKNFTQSRNLARLQELQAANALLGSTPATELTAPELALAIRTGEFSSGGMGGSRGSDTSDV
ncbi:hypothetical protein ABPG77_004417 [Micractinium sp. CCAP 211/92]